MMSKKERMGNPTGAHGCCFSRQRRRGQWQRQVAIGLVSGVSSCHGAGVFNFLMDELNEWGERISGTGWHLPHVHLCG